MKRSSRILFNLFLILFLSNFTCVSKKDGHEIVFKIHEVKGSKAKIGHFEGLNFKIIDSSNIINGYVSFKGSQKLLEGLYLLKFDSISVDFIVSEQYFTIEIPTLQNLTECKIQNSETNTIFYNYKNIVKKKKELVKDLKSKTSGNATEPATQNSIKEIGKYIQQYRDSIFIEKPGNLACKIIKAGLDVKPALSASSNQNNNLLYHVFDNIDLTDERMIRTPYLEENIIKALKLTPFIPDSLATTCDFIINKSQANSDIYKYTLKYLKGYFENNNKPWMDVLYTYLIKKYYLTGKATWADTNEILTVKSVIKRMDPILTGKVAPKIDFIDSSGILIPLHSLKARYTILYFWDADCSHCLETTPKLWEYYKSLKGSDIEVYAVTIQQIPYSWKDYLRKHKMSWINVFEPEKIPDVYKTYQIGTTPCIYLLDKEKRILCKQITFEELKKYLSMLI